MDLATVLLALTSAGAVATGLTSLVTSLRSLRAAVAPTARRGQLKWALLEGSAATGAAQFAASCEAAGLRSPARVKIGDHTVSAAPALVGVDVVVLYDPGQEALDLLLPVIREVNPGASILVLAPERVAVDLRKPRIYLGNSDLRIRLDLVGLAEAA